MVRNDILITGMGVISAAGNDLAQTLGAFERGTRNAGRVSLFETRLTYPAFEVKGMPAEAFEEGRRTLGLAVIAVEQAMKDARLSDLRPYRIGVCLGTTVASQLNDLQFYTSYRQTGKAPMTSVDRFLSGNIADAVARRIGARGPRMTIVNACSSGTDAVGVALSWLRSDLCDIVIAGGADELNHVPYCGFGSLGIVNPGLCAPFDRDRKGLNLGEGAGVVVLEKKDHAAQRGVSSDLFVAGYGACSDAYHLTAPHPDGIGLRAAIQRALDESGIKAADISFVNAHGTGTHDNDLVEGKVLADMFGPSVTMLSTKGFTGHTLGAAGGLEAAFTAAALRTGWVPASAGFQNRDEDIPMMPVRERTRITGRYALSTSLAFGGNNAVIAIGRESRI